MHLRLRQGRDEYPLRRHGYRRDGPQRSPAFSDSKPNLKFAVFTGTGADHLVIREGTRDDKIRLRDQGALAFGPAIDLDSFGDFDVTMTSGNDSIVEVYGGGRFDQFSGGPGEDRLYAHDGNEEFLDGGSEADRTTNPDPTDHLISVETVIH